MDSTDLDAILNQALDDFEEQELAEKLVQVEQDAARERAVAEQEQRENERRANRDEMESLMNSLQDPTYGPTLQATLKNLSDTSGGNENVKSLFGDLASQFEQNLKPSYMPSDPDSASEIQGADREVAATMAMIGQAQQGMEGFEAGRMEEVGEGMMEDMMQQFESLGEKEDYNEVSSILPG